MSNLHAQWQEISDKLRDTTLELDGVVSAVVAKMAAGGYPKPDRFEAVRLTRQRVNEKRTQMDEFLDRHVR
jgi:hypothetical protein